MASSALMSNRKSSADSQVVTVQIWTSGLKVSWNENQVKKKKKRRQPNLTMKGKEKVQDSPHKIVTLGFTAMTEVWRGGLWYSNTEHPLVFWSRPLDSFKPECAYYLLYDSSFSDWFYSTAQRRLTSFTCTRIFHYDNILNLVRVMQTADSVWIFQITGLFANETFPLWGNPM